jgi:hypothetical protein
VKNNKEEVEVKEAKFSGRESTGRQYIDCSECEGGGNGSDVHKCSSGLMHETGGKNKCYMGILMKGLKLPLSPVVASRINIELGIVRSVHDDVAMKLDEMADLCAIWEKHRKDGHVPYAIRSALLMLAKDLTFINKDRL